MLGTAGVVVPLVRRFGLNPVLGFLGAGALLGPLGLGTFVDRVPALYWVTVTDAANVSGIADLGIVFLLFLIGLELSFERLMAMRRLVFGLGALQIAVTTAAIAAVAAAAGQTPAVAVILGGCLALSSTAIVLEIIAGQGRLTTAMGRASFSVLLAQDLAVVPLLMFISILGADTGESVLLSAGWAIVHALAAVAIIVLVGRVVLRPLFRLVAGTQSSELFIAANLFVVVATGVVAAVAGLSMALGAFVAGLLLAETEYRKAIEATIDPFKGLLLGVFFFTVGMGIDVRELARAPLWVLACVLGLIALKATIVALLGRPFKLSWAAAIGAGLMLGAGGEFAFVGVGLAASLGLLAPPVASFVFAVTSLTMALLPLLSVAERRIRARLDKQRAVDPELEIAPTAREKHAIVVGYGRVGTSPRCCGVMACPTPRPTTTRAASAPTDATVTKSISATRPTRCSSRRAA